MGTWTLGRFVVLLGMCTILAFVDAPPVYAGYWFRIPYLHGVWGSSSSDVFAVGGSGLILHYDGTGWSEMDGSSRASLNDVWGISSSDVFVVGGRGTILHHDGQVWTQMKSHVASDLLGIWGSSASDVYAVGKSGTILHYDGSSWSKMKSGTENDLTGVWGLSSSDVFAVGDWGTILHYDGSNWISVGAYSHEFLSDVWGSSSENVVAVGWSNSYPHESVAHGYDGVSWSRIDHDIFTRVDLYGIWGEPSSVTLAVGKSGVVVHYDGGSWDVAVRTGNDLRDVWGSSPSNVFAVGAYRSIFHYDGHSWSLMLGGFVVDPACGNRGQELDVTVHNVSAGFLELTGARALDFDAGVVVEDFNVDSARQEMAVALAIHNRAELGKRAVCIAVDDEAFSLIYGFSVEQAPISLWLWLGIPLGVTLLAPIVSWASGQGPLSWLSVVGLRSRGRVLTLVLMLLIGGIGGWMGAQYSHAISRACGYRVGPELVDVQLVYNVALGAFCWGASTISLAGMGKTAIRSVKLLKRS